MLAVLAEHPGGARDPRLAEEAGKPAAIELAAKTDAPLPVDTHHLPEAVVVRVHRVRNSDDDTPKSTQVSAATLYHRDIGIEEVGPGLDIRRPRCPCRKDEDIGIPHRRRIGGDRDIDTRVLQVEHLCPEDGLIRVVEDDLISEAKRGGEECRLAPHLSYA